VGALAIAGLPPLNGFVSEWLLLQSFLFTNELPRAFVNMLLPLGAALLVLAAALAGYVMVKFFGVIFLGQPREAALRTAHDAGTVERIGLAWLALACVLLGLLPTQIIPLLSRVIQPLGFSGLALEDGSWWLLVPLPHRQTSYAPLAFLAVILSVVLLTIAAVRVVYHRRVRLSAAWDCGFGRLNSRMQDTAEGFGQPIRHLFSPFFAMVRELPSPFDAAPRYSVVIGDRIWRGLYLPLGTFVRGVANALAWLQQGRVATYLLYSFVTLVALLALML
jgi:NADH:ubiquinone oxidoreductase subunit 5 (subunit L)/multisubunit Na+/H+ antiporter MnhA subunit